MRPQAQARGCSLHLESGGVTAGQAWGDGARVRQVLYNSASFAGQSGSFKTSGTLGLVGIGYQF